MGERNDGGKGDGVKDDGGNEDRSDDAGSEDDGSSDSISMDGNGGGTIVKMRLKVETWGMELRLNNFVDEDLEMDVERLLMMEL